MRYRYTKWDPKRHAQKLDLKSLFKIFNHLLLQTGGDVDEALHWMEHLGEQYGFLDKDFDIEQFKKLLEEHGVIESGGKGLSKLTRKGERLIREDSLGLIFSNLKRDQEGNHRVPDAGTGGERLTETRYWRFGDSLTDIDSTSTLRNAIHRSGIDDLNLREEDFAVYESEHRTSTATVLAIDVSHSMILYGEDRFTPAKKVALALTELILRHFKKDSLDIVLFGNEAEQVPIRQLPYVQVGPYYTNTKAGLALAQQILLRKKQANKQIFMITDGKPTVLVEHGRMYRNAFGLDRRIRNKTLEEASRCRRKKICITTFMIASDPYLQEFVEDLTRINRGRAYFASPDNVGSYLFVDFIRNRNRRLR